MRSQSAQLRVLNLSILGGVVRFFDTAGNLVGLLSADEWWIGTENAARLSLDPQGGLRLRSATDVLVGTLDQQGLTLRDSGTGLVLAEYHPDHLTLHDTVGTDDIVVSASSADTFPDPKYKSATEANPGTTFVAPAVTTFGTGDDLEIAHACAWEAGAGAPVGTTFTPPAGFTEQFDEINPGAPSTLHVSAATKQPATNAAATFTNSSSGFQSGVTTSVMVRGGSGVSPSIRSISKAFFETTATSAPISMAKPTGLATGDEIIAIVSMGNAVGSVPIGWTTPDGFRFLGANFLAAGSGSTLSTAAVGVWWKPITDGASEPATYDITINFGPGHKYLHAALIAVQNPDTATGGPNITIGGNPVKKLLASSTLAAGSLELVNFTGIPGGPFRHLEVVFYGVSNTSADAVRNIQVRLNGDSGANYSWQLDRDSVASTTIGAVGIRVGELDGSGAGRVSVGKLDILDYSNGSDARKVLLAHTMAEENLNVVLFTGIGTWATAAAVNAVRILTDSALTTFAAGSRAYLYGW